MAGQQNPLLNTTVSPASSLNNLYTIPQRQQVNNFTPKLGHQSSVTNAVKKQGVSGESSDATGQFSRDILITTYEKDFR